MSALSYMKFPLLGRIKTWIGIAQAATVADKSSGDGVNPSLIKSSHNSILWEFPLTAFSTDSIELQQISMSINSKL